MANATPSGVAPSGATPTPVVSAYLRALRTLRAAVDEANPYPVHGWRNGGTIVACHPAAVLAFQAAHDVSDAKCDRIIDRTFGGCAFDQVRDLVWFPDHPGCPICGTGDA